MAAGDLLILSNDTNIDTIGNAGVNYDALWPTVEQAFGLGAGSASTNGRVTLSAGKYLVMYSEYFNTTDTTNNERIEIQGEIHTVAGGVQGGYGQGYIRKSSGDQECAVTGSMILDLSSTQDVFIRFYRTDNSTTGTVLRQTGFGSFVILELDGTDNYGRYSRSTTQSTSTSVVATIGFDTNDEQDTGFSRSGSVITVTNAGRYFVTYSMDINQTGTGREDVISYLTNNGTEINGTRGYCYLRGADGTQDGALTWAGVLDLSASTLLDLRSQAPQSATINITDAQIQIWQLPGTADTVIVEATNGDYNTATNFTWDTVPHIDTAEFTASGATNTVTLDNGNAFLTFCTFSQLVPDTPQRAVPRVQFEVGGSLIPGVADCYHRNSGGSGIVAVNAKTAFFAEGTNVTLRTNITPAAASGTLTNDNAQWSVLSLASIFGAYVPPPTITDIDTDNQILYPQTNIIASGLRFGDSQGAGKFELWSDTIGTIKVAQTIDSWGDTSIQFDAVQGSLPDDTTIYAVVTSADSSESPPFAIGVGVPILDSYFTIIDNLNPDHWWRFDNDGYADNGTVGANPITSSVLGDGGAFDSTPICEQNVFSWRINDQAGGGRRECANSNSMNGQVETTRSMGGWIRFEQIDTALSCLYEEGGGVNNVTILQGLGGILIASYADTSDDNAQAYSDFRLEAGRAYHHIWRFDHTASPASDRRFELFIDGVKQSVTSGNPLTSGDLDAHSGDISFGGPGGSLEVGGTDVTFPTQLDTRYANWASWTVSLDDADILELFQRGARPQDTIATDSAGGMQVQVDALTKSRSNQANDIRIFEPDSGTTANLSLDFDGIVFDPGTSIQVEWRGAGVLTITNLNGANTDVSKCYTPRAGTVTVINPAQLTLTGLQNPSEVRVYEAGTTTEVAGQENVTTGTFNATIQVPSVDIVIAALEYQNIRLTNVDTTTDLSLPIQQRFDRNYENP